MKTKCTAPKLGPQKPSEGFWHSGAQKSGNLKCRKTILPDLLLSSYFDTRNVFPWIFEISKNWGRQLTTFRDLRRTVFCQFDHEVVDFFWIFLVRIKDFFVLHVWTLVSDRLLKTEPRNSQTKKKFFSKKIFFSFFGSNLTF